MIKHLRNDIDAYNSMPNQQGYFLFELLCSLAVMVLLSQILLMEEEQVIKFFLWIKNFVYVELIAP